MFHGYKVLTHPPWRCGVVLACVVQVCVPLFDMIRHWVFDGQLEDPACEFFIVPNSQALGSGGSSGGAQQQQQGGSAERDLWRDAYRLEPAKLPPFITKVRHTDSWVSHGSNQLPSGSAWLIRV